jgi:hypothetical protein
MLAVHSRQPAQSAIHKCAARRLSEALRQHAYSKSSEGACHGSNTEYLGHVEIVPSLNQAEMTTWSPSLEAAGATDPEDRTPSYPRTRTRK